MCSRKHWVYGQESFRTLSLRLSTPVKKTPCNNSDILMFCKISLSLFCFLGLSDEEGIIPPLDWGLSTGLWLICWKLSVSFLRGEERGWGKYEEVEEKVEEGRKGHPSASISIYQWTCTDSTAIEIDTRKRCNGPLAALQGTIVGEGFWQFLGCDLLDQTIHWMCNE